MKEIPDTKQCCVARVVNTIVYVVFTSHVYIMEMPNISSAIRHPSSVATTMKINAGVGVCMTAKTARGDKSRGDPNTAMQLHLLAYALAIIIQQ